MSINLIKIWFNFFIKKICIFFKKIMLFYLTWVNS